MFRSWARFVFITIILFSLTTSAFGWNRRGHMMIVAVAFAELGKSDSAKRDQILLLLKNHPAYNTWRSEYKRNNPDPNGNDVSKHYSFEAYVFMRAAVWADDIKRQRRYRPKNKTWHYVNYPVRLPDNIDFGTVKPKANIFVGYNASVKVVESQSTSKRNRAKGLAWVFHLVGDIHQPLHSVAMFSDDFPTGDSGGNAQCIRLGQGKATVALHSYWDGFLGSKSNVVWDGVQAFQDNSYYRNLYKTIKPENEAPSIQKWAKESAEYALPKVYKHKGTLLDFAKEGIKNGKKQCIPRPTLGIIPAKYHKNSKTLATQRMVIAGYRLAKALSSLNPPA